MNSTIDSHRIIETFDSLIVSVIIGFMEDELESRCIGTESLDLIREFIPGCMVYHSIEVSVLSESFQEESRDPMVGVP